MVPDASGAMFGHPAHSGNFAAHFEAGPGHSSPLQLDCAGAGLSLETHLMPIQGA